MNQLNDVFVVVDANNGQMRRYITGGGPRLMTHEAVHPDGGPVSFDPVIVEEFRVRPPEALRVHQPSTPPTPPAGGTPVAMVA